MLKLYKKFFIHYSTLLIIACLSIKGSREILSLTLISVILHEAGHLLILYLLGGQTDSLVLHAFGISINPSPETLTDNTMLLTALGGPFFSLILSGLFYFLFRPLFMPNLCLGVINLLPILPLDGGRVLGSILLKVSGRKSSRILMRSIGCVFGAVLIPSGILVLLLSGYNISLLLLGIFIIADSTANPFSCPPSFIRKKAVLGEIYIIPQSLGPRQTAEMLPSDSIGAVVDDKGKIIKLVTAKGIYHSLAEIK